MSQFYKIRTEAYHAEVVSPSSNECIQRDTVYCEPSPVDMFLFQTGKAPHSSKESVTITSDLYMLFNQERLDRMSLQSLVDHFANIPQSDTSISALRSKLSDEQLASFVKSRYIQSRSELLSWSQYLMNEYADTMDEATIQAALGGEHTDELPEVPPAPPAE